MTISAYGSCKYHDTVAKEPSEQLCKALSPTLESCGLPRPLQMLIASYAVELPEDLCCMTISQIEAGGDKTAAVAMRYLNRCEVVHEQPATEDEAAHKYVTLRISSRSSKHPKVDHKPHLEIIQIVCLDAWRTICYHSGRDLCYATTNLLLDESTAQTFKDKICFHTIALRSEDNILPDIDPQNKNTLYYQLKQEQTDVAREVVEASKKA